MGRKEPFRKEKNTMFEMTNEDKDLQDIFNGEDKPLHPETIHITLGKPSVAVSKKESSNTAEAKKTAQSRMDKAKDALWEPAKPEPNWVDKLKDCAKWTAGFGGLCLLLFYWQQTGQMEASAAVPSMCVCTALAGFGCGKNAMRGANR
jgi:hypothetical protein